MMRRITAALAICGAAALAGLWWSHAGAQLWQGNPVVVGMPFTAVVQTDDSFTDAGAPICLSSHTPTTAGTWTYISGDACATSSGLVISTTGNLSDLGAISASPQLVYAADTTSTDQTVTYTIGSGATTNSSIQVMMRIVNMCCAVIVRHQTTAGFTTLEETIDSGGGVTQAGVATGTPVTGSLGAAVAGDIIKAQIVGNTLTFYVNGVSSLTYTIALYTSGGATKHVGLSGNFTLANQMTHWNSQ